MPHLLGKSLDTFHVGKTSSSILSAGLRPVGSGDLLEVEIERRSTFLVVALELLLALTAEKEGCDLVAVAVLIAHVGEAHPLLHVEIELETRNPPAERLAFVLGRDVVDDRVPVSTPHELRGDLELALPPRHPGRLAQGDIDHDLVVELPVDLLEERAMRLRDPRIDLEQPDPIVLLVPVELDVERTPVEADGFHQTCRDLRHALDHVRGQSSRILIAGEAGLLLSLADRLHHAVDDHLPRRT